MRAEKKKKLEAAGWTVGDARDFPRRTDSLRTAISQCHGGNWEASEGRADSACEWPR